MSGIAREQYRRVAALLHDAQGVSGIRAIMITSAVPGEGKTLKPTMHKIFQISSVVGLTTGLDPARPPTLTVHQITPRLAVLPAGRPTSDPMASLTSERMRKLPRRAARPEREKAVSVSCSLRSISSLSTLTAHVAAFLASPPAPIRFVGSAVAVGRTPRRLT